MRLRVLAMGVIMAALFAGRAEASRITAITPTSAELIASGGEVIIYFAGQTAGFDSVLNLIEPTGFSGNPFFQNHTTPVGTSLSLGSYASGTTLRFRLDVTTSGQSFFSGPGSGNPDGIVHVGHAQWAADATIPVNGVFVGFEDLFGGGDMDFDDNNFVFTNVTSRAAPSVPEPASMVLIGSGLLFLRRKLAARA